MLIQTRDYVRECGGDPRDLTLAGQESIGTTWSICKMNMLLHGIDHADIRPFSTNAGPVGRVDGAGVVVAFLRDVGTSRQEAKETVSMPFAVRTGQKLRIHGRGSQPVEGSAGDVIVEVTVEEPGVDEL